MSEETVTNNSLKESEAATTAEPDEESFASLLEKSMSQTERLQRGRKITTKVISISGDLVYVAVGGKTEGVVALSEFLDDRGMCRIKVGDEIEAFFLSVEDGMKKLTTLVHGYSSVDLNALRDAYDAGLPVTGEVKQGVKGGFEVLVNGIRCFCPFSQIDLRGGREGNTYLGHSFPFRILKYEEDGRNVILSRKILLEQEKEEQREKLKASLSVGMKVNARVRSLQKFGAFVDLGGIDGLVPTSELSWGRMESPAEVLSIGQEVTAKIISLDWNRNRVTLSIKALQPDPWSAVSERYLPDSRVSGTIVRLAPFGAFMSLEPGVDGLIHISNLGAGRRINHPKEVVEVGQWVEAYILSVDPHDRKISLSLQPRQQPKKVVLPAVGELLEGTVERIMPFGIFLKLDSGVTGLIPNSELGTPRGTDHSRLFPLGSSMKVVVIETDPTQGRISLSRKGVIEREELEEFNQFKDTTRKEQTSGTLSSFGEKLKAKLEEKGLRQTR